MNSNFADDLAYVREIAETGAKAPSLGGRYLVMWGVLMSATMLTHWAIISDVLAVDTRYGLLILWIGACVLGTIGNFVIAGTMKSRPGVSAAHNKVDRIIWPVAGMSVFAYFFGVTLTVMFRDASPILFDTLLPVAFLSYAIAFAGRAAFAGTKLAWGQTIVSVLLVGLTVFLVGTPTLYLVAALGLFGLTVIPGLLLIRDEPSMVV